MSRLDDDSPPDPPAPSPARLVAVGAALGDVLEQAPWKVALVASSSWSHAFLCDKTWRLRPDLSADRRLYVDMVANDLDAIAARSLGELEEAGQHEVLNWFLLWGAMHRLGTPLTWSTMVETSIFNSNKVFATYVPDGLART